MIEDERIPGVTFSLLSSKLAKQVGEETIIEVKLLATYTKQEIYEEVMRKLNGLRIYTSTNLTEEAMGLLKSDIEVEKEKYLDFKAIAEVQIHQLSMENHELRTRVQNQTVELGELQLYRDRCERWFAQFRQQAQG